MLSHFLSALYLKVEALIEHNFKQRRLEFFEPTPSQFKCLAKQSIKGKYTLYFERCQLVNTAFRRNECSFLGMADVIEQMQQATSDKTLILMSICGWMLRPEPLLSVLFEELQPYLSHSF